MSESEPFQCILYVFDSLRYDWLGCNGNEKNLTPTMDSIADDGINFDQAYSQAIWTYPSSASIFSGLYPESHGSQQFDEVLGSELPHLADGFSETDVDTVCFSTTLGVSPERGFKQGFDEFYHIGENDSGLRPDIMDILNEQLLTWIDQHSNTDFFAVVWAMGTHHPYLTPEDVENPSKPLINVPEIQATQASMRKKSRDEVSEIHSYYDSVVNYSDGALNELVELLKSNGIYENTSMIVTSDHGEVFSEHARLENSSQLTQSIFKRIFGSSRCRYYGLFDESAFIGHQGIHPYEELIHVPLIIKPSSDLNVGERTKVEYEEIVELIDILPTIYDAAGLDVPELTQGTSIFKLLDGVEDKKYSYSCSQIHNGNLVYRSIYDGEHKLLKWDLESVALNEFLNPRVIQSTLAYLIGDSPVTFSNGMKTDFNHNHDDLLQILSKHISQCREIDSDTEDYSVDDETINHLENLGYK
ncbi:sulfatase [Haloferax volcanii]|uniref:Sulfatase n=1 Tax=Haloferax volcanii JCM 10717 TaxID=1227458 RepID=M0HXQ6_HALVO|nr:sulfatase [Haloferax alexandrinus]ELZ87909.1 sulfatase [Haloferax alexandrinus JCM 10717]